MIWCAVPNWPKYEVNELGEVTYDSQKKNWRAELSTQKYLKTIGRYMTETEAHGALLDAAVDALNKE